MSLPGDYEAIRLLGAGGSGSTWLTRRPARLRVEGEHVVVKELRRPLTEQQFEILSSELALLASLTVPELVPLYEVTVTDGRARITMAYAPLGSLDRPRRPVDRSEVLLAVAAAARAAHAIHEAGAVHGNIKPANVLLHERGCWLSDAASAAVPADVPSPVEYADPAVLRGAPPSRSSDVWSLAVTMHRALTGHSLYREVPDVDRNAAIHHVLSTPPRLGGGLHPGEARVIAECLAAAGERPTATEVAGRIAPLVEGTG